MSALRLVALCALTILVFGANASEARAESTDVLCARTKNVIISPACLQALDLVHDEFPSEDVIEHINSACREEVEESRAKLRYKELSPNGTIVLCPLNKKTLYIEDDEGVQVVFSAVPGRFVATEE